MALITCPECGRQNVSDSAAACPECGYAIREHFEKIKAEEELKKQQEEEEKNKEKEAIRKKAFEKDRRAKAINDLKKKMLPFKICMIVFILLAVIITVFQCLAPDSGSEAFFIVFFLAFGYVVYCLIEIDKIKQDIKLAEVDIDQYETKAELESIKKQNSKKCPACPNCGSKNTKRISTVSRAVSAETLGFASAKIGKQYQCNDCNHLW